MSRSPNPDAARAPGLNMALSEAILALRAGRASDAERLAAGMLARGAGGSLAAKILAQALLVQGRAEAAIGPLEQAMWVDDDPELSILLGRALGAVGRDTQALEALNRAVAHRPLISQAFLTLGDHHWKRGRISEAVAVLEEGLSLAPDEPLLSIGLGYFHLKRQDHAKARGLFARVHAAAPAQYDALVGLAMASAMSGDFTAAAEHYRRALELRPMDATARINLGKCLMELGQRELGQAEILGAAREAGHIMPVVTALADTAHGRLFLRPSAARAFLRGERP